MQLEQLGRFSMQVFIGPPCFRTCRNSCNIATSVKENVIFQERKRCDKPRTKHVKCSTCGESISWVHSPVPRAIIYLSCN